ncbi:MAG TPA: nucleotidyl transferase AbiEii/AbiGii toxin family protein, partial [Anaerolineales bacterium]|nr:nucleotidyl transferase AbiEii/AbiGii toxin family protein [Anaerolineales bacterium]
MQLKARVKDMAQKSRVPAQAVLQNFMMERLLERIAVSKYKDMFILKGGMLIASMIGIGSRTTMDMDATLRRFPLSDEAIRSTFEDICSIQLDDDVTLILNSITTIRDEDEYGGYRLAITARYEGINTPVKIDLTTGDVITPKAILYRFPSSFEKKNIDIWAYNIETILAEKVETILRRGVLNTRPRDFYDVYILTKTRGNMINKKTFSTALTATAEKRLSTAAIRDRENTLAAIQSDTLMKQRWDLYSTENFYANDIDFDEVIASIVEILK